MGNDAESIKITIVPTGKRALKKLPKSTKNHLIKKIKGLSKNPHAGQPLTGISYLSKLKINYQGVTYRVAYLFKSKEKKIYIIHVSTRENFYRELERIIG